MQEQTRPPQAERPAAPSSSETGSGGFRPASGGGSFGGGGGPRGGGGGGGGGGARGRGGGRRPRYFHRRKVCSFCVEHATGIEYKNPDLLNRYLSDRARIDPRRKTGTCARHQRMLAQALKRARHLALLPYTMGHRLETGTYHTSRRFPSSRSGDR